MVLLESVRVVAILSGYEVTHAQHARGEGEEGLLFESVRSPFTRPTPLKPPENRSRSLSAMRVDRKPQTTRSQQLRAQHFREQVRSSNHSNHQHNPQEQDNEQPWP
jgi:hypothetical protein